MKSPAARQHTAPARGRRLSGNRGSALFLLLIMSVVMVSILGATFTYISVTQKAERRSNVRLESTYAAEYAFELAYQQLNTLINQNTMNLPNVAATSGVTNLTTAPTSTFSTAAGYNWTAFITVPVEGGVPVGAHAGFNPVMGGYKFMTVVEFTRAAWRDTAPVKMHFQREWDYTLTPLFQYAIFYNTDMELFPGAAFNVSGRVHSNGRIYTGTTASIRFSDYVTHVGGVSNTYSPLDPRSRGALNGSITYAKQAPVVTSRQSPPGDVMADTSDGNHNNDGPRELVEMPNSWQADANSSERLYNKAGIKIVVNTSGVDATADNGVAVRANTRAFLTADGTRIPDGDPMANYLATLISVGAFQDYREDAKFITTDVDIAKVNTAYNSGGLPQSVPNAATWPNNNTVPAALKNQPIPAALRGKTLWNGIVYVADISNGSGRRTGVKLVNGSSLPDGSKTTSPVAGLTIVTPNAAFIVGDYNTGGVPPVNTDASLTASNHTSTYTVQPAAVIADAVTVVSSNWTSGSYNTKPNLNDRPAANTTINSALISGIVASDGQAYSGGVENYVRLLEDWGNKRLTYYGSMINVYESRQSTAPWQQTGNYYQAPARNWYFDTNFLDPNKLPPGTPIVRSLKRGQWVQDPVTP